MWSWVHVPVLCLGLPVLLQAHGLQAQLELEAPVVVLRCTYTDGTPADAEVLVYSPDELDRSYQRQRTDVHGRVTFVPDAAGEWRIVVDDGMGHRTELTVTVDENGVASPRQSDPWSRTSVALWVAALVFVLVVVWMQASRRRRTAV